MTCDAYQVRLSNLHIRQTSPWESQFGGSGLINPGAPFFFLERCRINTNTENKCLKVD